jgi:hypothetical protein
MESSYAENVNVCPDASSSLPWRKSVPNPNFYVTKCSRERRELGL